MKTRVKKKRRFVLVQMKEMARLRRLGPSFVFFSGPRAESTWQQLHNLDSDM